MITLPRRLPQGTKKPVAGFLLGRQGKHLAGVLRPFYGLANRKDSVLRFVVDSVSQSTQGGSGFFEVSSQNAELPGLGSGASGFHSGNEDRHEQNRRNDGGLQVLPASRNGGKFGTHGGGFGWRWREGAIFGDFFRRGHSI